MFMIDALFFELEKVSVVRDL